MSLRTLCLSWAALVLWSSCLFAQVGLLSPSDPIIGGQVQGTDFVEGSPGFGANQWPFAETPVNAIDGVGQKYLNFGELNTGFIVTPSGGSSIATGLQLWTANDAEERDPASYEIWGTNSPIAGGTLPLSDFTQISTGALNLPASRNAAGDAPLLVENSDTVLFANTTNYSSYLVFFPDVKNDAAANSMQVGDVQILGVPDLDSTLSLEVNQLTGSVSLLNGSMAPSVELNSYQIRANSGSLNPAGWSSFTDNPAFPAASAPGAGDGWEEGGGVNDILLAEAFLLGSSTIAPGETISLGQAYDTSVGGTDLAISYTRPDGFLGQVPVVYVMDAISCDFSGDGNCGTEDIDLLVENIAVGPADPATFDLTGDGIVDGADIDAWLAQAGAANLPSGNPYLPGDANLDGSVDGQDFIAWNINKFTFNASWTGGDFNASGTVDGQDFIVWNGFKFQSADGIAVPEPGIACSLLAAVLAMAWLRRAPKSLVGSVLCLFLVFGTQPGSAEAANQFRTYNFETGVPASTTASVIDSVVGTTVVGTGDNDGLLWLEVPGQTTRPLPPGGVMNVVDANALSAPSLDALFGTATYVDVSDGTALDSPAPSSNVALQFAGDATFEDINSGGGHRGVLVSADAYNNNDQVTAGQNVFESFSVVTQAWVRPDSSAMGTEQIVYQLGSEQGAATITADGLWKVGALGPFIPGGELTTTEPVAFDQWSHVAIARFGAEVLMYVNGNQVAQSPANTFFNTFASNTSLGSGDFGLSSFTGLVDDFSMSGLADGTFNPQDDIDFFQIIELEVNINQETGEAELRNTSDNPVVFSELSISSGLGGMDAADWLSISENYDADNGGELDATDVWNITQMSNVELAEAETPQNDGATLAPGQAVDLGGIWFQNPNRDVVVDLLDLSGERLPILVNYVDGDGMEVDPVLVGDLTFEGDITLADWAIFQQNLGSVFEGIGSAESYGFGDFDGDLDVDILDFQAFVDAFDAANGEGSFAASIPEPTFGLGACLLALLIGRRGFVKRKA